MTISGMALRADTAPISELSVSLDGRSVSVSLSESKIAGVAFSGSSSEKEKAVLDAVGEAMIGFTLREATEHAAIYAANALTAKGLLRRPAGIGLPKAMGPEMALAEALLRALYRAAPLPPLKPDDWNFEDRGPTPAWVARERKDKVATVRGLLGTFLTGAGVGQDAIAVVDIDKYERIDVRFSEIVPIGVKPKMLMDFERFLRTQTGERLEVFVTEMKDLNRIRRL